jgi:hypothetical protein
MLQAVGAGGSGYAISEQNAGLEHGKGTLNYRKPIWEKQPSTVRVGVNKYDSKSISMG